MTGIGDFTPEEEQQLLREIADLEVERAKFRKTATPDLASNVSQISQIAPHLGPEVVLPLAQAVSVGAMPLEQAQTTALDTAKMVLTDPQTYEVPQSSRSWLGRVQDAVTDKLKTGSRWGFAGLNLVPQLVTNLGARAYSGLGGPGGPGPWQDSDPSKYYQAPTTDLSSGWFASTDLGALLTGKDAGDGFFIGEDAQKYQQEKVNQYRGTINGNGWTYGRGVAFIGFQPESRAYNILSGVVDAAIALSVPSIPGTKVAKAAVTSQAERAGLRSLAGLTNFEDATIIRSKVGDWLSSDRGTAIMDRMVNIKTIDEALETFDNVPTGFVRDIVNADSRTAVRDVLERNLGLTVTSTEDINLSRVSDFRRSVMDGVFRPSSPIRAEFRRLGAKMPDRSLVINFDNELDNAKSLRQVNDYMKTLRVDEFVDSKTGSTVTRSQLLSDLADLYDPANFGNYRNVMDRVDDAIVAGLERTGRFKGQQEAARQALRHMRTRQDSALHGRINDEGVSNIFAMVDPENQLEVIGRNVGEVHTFPFDTAGWMSEERRYEAFLPDPRALRRATSKFNWIFEKDSVFAKNPEVFGEARLPIAVLDSIQNKIWRTATLATGGYATRNISESMIRATMAPGIKTGPLHPFEWAMLVMRKKGIGTVTGVEYSDKTAELLLRRELRNFREATRPAMREMVDPVSMRVRSHQTGAWAEASRGGDRTYYRQGLADNVHLASEDPINRLIAEQMLDGRTDNQEILDWLRNDPDGRVAAKHTQARYTNAKPGNADDPNLRVTYDFYREVDGKPVLNEANWNKYINGYLRPALQDVAINGDPRILQIIANGQILGQFVKDGKQVSAFKYIRSLPGVPDELTGYSDEFNALLDSMIDDPVLFNKLPERVKRRVNTADRGDSFASSAAGEQIRKSLDKTVDHLFGNVFGAKEARLNRSPAYRQFYYRMIDNLTSEMSRETASEVVSKLKYAFAKDAEDYYMDLRRLRPISTVDGKQMYVIGDEMVTKTRWKELVKEADQARQVAKEGFSDKWAARWVGSKERWEKIKGIADGSISGKDPAKALSLDQIDAYASGYALDETKRLFYNAAEKSNFGDIMRIISPFGSAWAEVMQAWYKQVLVNPNRLKNFGVTFRGIRDMDPEGDGKGFIYKDPVTGEMMYNYPFVSAMAPLLTGGAFAFGSQALLGQKVGLRASGIGGLVAGAGYGAYMAQRAQVGGAQPQLTAPVKSLNMALNVLPSVGPVVQMASNQILGDKPQFDDLRSILLPYGTYEPTPTGVMEAITPSWAKKVIEAVRANPDNDRIFADLYMDAYRALFATGQYDTNNNEDMQILRDRAAQSARYMLGLRAIGQFLGPARPDVVYNVPTAYKDSEITIEDVKYLVKDGNIPNNVLAKAFRLMQEDDYENAVANFMQTFGDNSLLYVRGTTEAISQGIDASEQFGDWERQNGSFKDRNPNVYGYFAPTGSDFDLETYLRQIKTGDRRRVVDPIELQADAEAVVGKAMYRQAVRQMGTDPTPQQTLALKSYRAYLYEALPGFATAVLDIKVQARTIANLETAANDPLATDNPIAKGLRGYFEVRDQMISIANQRRIDAGKPPVTENALSGAGNADLRAILRHTGDMMSLNPELVGFERVWSRVLFDEVDIET